MIINVKSIICSQCTSYEKGTALYNTIVSALAADKITVDMEGVVLSSSAFFNASIGRLVHEYGYSLISSRLEFKHLSPGDNFQLRNSINLAKKIVADGVVA